MTRLRSARLKKVRFRRDPIFKILVPTSCPGVKDAKVLWPRNTWKDKQAYDKRARKLAKDFQAKWRKSFAGHGIDKAIADQCPGK